MAIGEHRPNVLSGWERFEETCDIIYGGSWTFSTNNSSGSSGTFYISSSLQATVSFKFYGTQIALIGAPRSNGNTSVSVNIDGITENVIQQGYGLSSIARVWYEKFNLTPGWHDVFITKNDAKEFVFDAIDVNEGGFVWSGRTPTNNVSTGTKLQFVEQGWRRIENDYGLLEYIGSWSNMAANTNFSNFNQKQTSTLNSYVRFGLIGSKIRIIASNESILNGADISVKIGSLPIETYSSRGDLRHQTLQYQRLNFPFGFYKVQITHNDSRSNQVFRIDAIDIDYNGQIVSYNYAINTGLVLYNGGYYAYDGFNWKLITTSTPTEANFQSGMSMQILESITENDIRKLIKNDSLEIYHYSTNKSSATLDITNYHNPIDLLSSPEILSWSSYNQATLSYNARPKRFSILPTGNIDPRGELKTLAFSTTESGNGSIRFAISTDDAITWKSFYSNSWQIINVNNLDDFALKGMSKGTFNSIFGDTNALKAIIPNNKVRIAYYLEKWSDTDVANVDALNSMENLLVATPSVSSVNLLTNMIDDKYYGLIFSDMNGNYYSNALGEIINLLDFGNFVAGQETTSKQISLNNFFLQAVKNLTVSSISSNPMLKIELSKTNNPFTPEESLIFNEEIDVDGVINFFIRLKANNDLSSGNYSFQVQAEAESN